jgi:hypothetical protein
MSESRQSSHGAISSFFMRHWLFWLLLGSAIIRLVTLGRECFWYDESFTALVSTLPVKNALQAVAGDVHPPLWYLISWLVARVLGASEASLRLPAAAFGILSIYQMYLLVKAINPDAKSLAFSSCALMAVWPAQIYYSQEARAYTLLTWLVLFAVTSILQRSWLRVVLALTLIMYTHNLGFCYVSILGIWMLIRGRVDALRYTPICLAYLPWMAVAWMQSQYIASGFWIITPGAGQLAYYLMYNTFFVRIPSWLQLHTILAACGLSAIAIYHHLRDRTYTPIIILTLVPSWIMFAVSLAWKPIMLERALLPSGALLTVLIASALLKKDGRRLLTVLIPVLLLANITLYSNEKRDYRPVAAHIEELAGDATAVYHTSIPSIIFLSHYLQTDDHFALPEIGDLDQSLTDPTKIAMGIKQREVSVDELIARGYRRLILLHTIVPGSDPEHIRQVEEIIAAHRVISRETVVNQRFAQFDIIVLELTALPDPAAMEHRLWPMMPRPRR